MVCVLGVLMPDCASRQPVAADMGDESLPLGLYKVVERECNYAAGAPEDRSRTRYLELVNPNASPGKR